MEAAAFLELDWLAAPCTVRELRLDAHMVPELLLLQVLVGNLPEIRVVLGLLLLHTLVGKILELHDSVRAPGPSNERRVVEVRVHERVHEW